MAESDRVVFAREALAHLKRARPQDAFVLDEERFLITRVSKDEKTSLVSLGNYWDEYQHAAPSARAGVFDRIVKFAALIDSEETFDEVRVLLTPRIRPRRYFEIDALELMTSLASKNDDAPKKVPPYTPFAEHLGVSLAIDRPEHIEYVSDPERYKVPKSELDEIALANLRRATKSGFEELRAGLFLGHWGDEYAPERMLMPELFAKLAVKGKPVAFIPGAERMYVVGSDDEESLMMVLALVEERMKTPRALLDFGFVLDDGNWRFFEPNGPLGEELGGRLALHLASAYARQRETLEKLEETGFVPNVMGLGKDEQIETTLTTWTNGAHPLLPRASLVALGGDGMSDIVTVTWSTMMEIAGDCLELDPKLYPPRWREKSFPDAAKLTKLRAAAIDMKGGQRASSEAPPVSGGSLEVVAPPPSRGRAVVIAIVTAVIVAALVYAIRS